MAAGDINHYANDLLLRFLDEFHENLRATFQAAFGDEWFEQGVQRHLHPDYFRRVREMLDSPMRVIDMGKEDPELYGVEHLSNIVVGNWALFKPTFRDRDRAKVWLAEIAEVRHNVSHRRQRHYLRRPELIRFAQNACRVLEAAGSPASGYFAGVADAVSNGASPWGSSLEGYLPPHDEILDQFVGRPHQFRALNEWLASDAPQLLIWGYGGAGKSALAYQFAREMRDVSPGGLQAVCWVSAKREEFVAGVARRRSADFWDLPSFVESVYGSLYGGAPDLATFTGVDLRDELVETRVLLVVDDLDSVLSDDALSEFLLFDLRRTRSRILFTSRQKVPGLRSIDVPGFAGPELDSFIRVRAVEHELDPDSCVLRANAIHSVTGGYPLFVDDLLRYARIDGLKVALEDWSQRRGDAAREYALRRQLEHLGDSARDVLMSLCVADHPLTTVEMSTVAGLTDEDVEHAVNDLLGWRLVGQTAANSDARPTFDLNRNTRRLAQRTYDAEPRMAGFREAYSTLTGARVPAARRAAIASAANVARSLAIRGDLDAAADRLKREMTGDLRESPELYGELGWVYSRRPEAHAREAREAFQEAHRLESRSERMFFFWADMERRFAEDAVGRLPDEELVGLWQTVSRIAEWGVTKCGPTQALCQVSGYAYTREAKTLEHLREFTQAQARFGRAVARCRRALEASPSDFRDIPRGALFRGAVVALEGLERVDEMADVLAQWRAYSEDEYYTAEVDRLVRTKPELFHEVALRLGGSAPNVAG